MSTPLLPGPCRFAALALALALAPARPASAQRRPPDVAGYAREQGRLGFEHFKAKRWSQARYHLREALAVKETAALYFYIGVCDARLGALVDAHRHLNKAVEIASAEGSGESAATRKTVLEEANQELADLAPRLPSIALRWAPSPRPEGASVQVDDEAVAPPVLAGEAPLPLDPGEHKVAAGAPGYRPRTVQVRLEEGQAQHLVELSLEPEPPPPPPPAPPAVVRPPPGGGWQKPVGYVGLGLGVALIGAGVVSSLRVGDASGGERDTLSVLQYVFYGSGVVVGGAGAYFAFFAPTPSKDEPARGASWQLLPALGPRQAGLGARLSF
jgi:hypothetical protein